MPFSAVRIFFRPTPRVLRYVVVLMKSANLNHTGRIDVWTKPGTVYFVAGLAAGLILFKSITECLSTLSKLLAIATNSESER